MIIDHKKIQDFIERARTMDLESGGGGYSLNDGVGVVFKVYSRIRRHYDGCGIDVNINSKSVVDVHLNSLTEEERMSAAKRAIVMVHHLDRAIQSCLTEFETAPIDEELTMLLFQG